MCGIIGYVGQRDAYPLLLTGLERVEYRGYDSVGICTTDGTLHLLKEVGRVEQFKNKRLPGKQGIAHSRWATHGGVSQKNAHPFIAHDAFALVHNGIIENYLELKEELIEKGVVFSSDTDSEVILHLVVGHYQHGPDKNLLAAVQQAVKQLQGAYAFAVLNKDAEEIVAARDGCPLLVGIGERENFIASDATAFIEHTQKVVYVDDFEIVRVTKDALELFDHDGAKKNVSIVEVRGNIEVAQKQGHPHFMLKEIMEQPQTIAETMKVELPRIGRPKRILIVACGTASYAGLLGKYILEKFAKIPVVHETASEFRYQEPLFYPDDLVIAITQSGETADTLAAIRLAKKHGMKTLGIINVRESTIAREVDQVIYTRAGPEIGVASTKAFTAQLIVLYKLAFQLGGKKFEGKGIATLIEETLKLEDRIKEIAQKYVHNNHFLYIGRNLFYPLALEGALKLKEISYIHAEAYPAGELKHGPIALISEDMPTIAICPRHETYEKMFSNIQEIKARQGKIIALASTGDERMREISDDIIYLPKADGLLTPLLVAVALQLFAYHLAALRGCDIDKPRNLAKSVTVE